MLEIFTSHFAKSNIVATGYLVAKNRVAIQQQTQVTVLSVPPSLLNCQYLVVQQALKARLSLADNDRTFLHCEREIFEELSRLKPHSNREQWIDTHGLLHGLEPPVQVVLVRDIKYQQTIDKAVEQMLIEYKPLRIESPPIQPGDELTRTARLLRTIFDEDSIERLAELLIFPQY